MDSNWQWCQFLPQPKRLHEGLPLLNPDRSAEKPTYAAIEEKKARNLCMCKFHHISKWRRTTRRTRPVHDPFSVQPNCHINSLHPPSPSWKYPYIWRHDPMRNSREWRTVHHTCLRLQKYQPTQTATHQPPDLRLRLKMACINHGPRHRSNQQTTNTHLLSTLHKLRTNQSNCIEPETRHMH